jgi:arylsulfatase A-like enzyme
MRSIRNSVAGPCATAVLLLVAAFLPGRSVAARPVRSAAAPNIILILADDLGFSDLGCYGGEIRTPNLDRLAARGVRFTQFYNASRCCPTRASLLTGLYPHQAGIGHMMEDLGKPGYQGQLNQNCVTLAEVLKTAGYRTLMVGKWHVAHVKFTGKEQLNYENSDPFWMEKSGWPLQRGFDEFYGTIHGVGSFFDPFTLTRGNTPIQPDRKDFYYTDALNDEAVKFVERYGAQAEPFFLYVAHTAPHWPLHARPEDIAKYEGHYDLGWDALREKRHQRMAYLGLIDRHSPLSTRHPTVPAWTNAPNKEWEAHRMAVYAAMIDRMDQGIGKILGKLDEMKIAENTVILFLSDNGACAENNQPGWYDVPSRTRDGKSVSVGNKHPEVMAGPNHVWQTVGPAWANASSTPFRWWKHYAHEGGTATPCIVSWPKKIKPGRLTHEPGHVIDLMPTLVALSGAKYPGKFKGHPIQKMEGVNLVPVFDGARAPSRTLFWEHEGNRAVRRGKWKLVAEQKGSWELYDLEQDRTEVHNLAGRNQDKVNELKEAYDRWARRTGVMAWDEINPYKKN